MNCRWRQPPEPYLLENKARRATHQYLGIRSCIALRAGLQLPFGILKKFDVFVTLHFKKYFERSFNTA